MGAQRFRLCERYVARFTLISANKRVLTGYWRSLVGIIIIVIVIIIHCLAGSVLMCRISRGSVGRWRVQVVPLLVVHRGVGLSYTSAQLHELLVGYIGGRLLTGGAHTHLGRLARR